MKTRTASDTIIELYADMRGEGLMSASLEPADLSPPNGEAIIAQLKQAGVGVIVSVPDIVTSDGLLWPISKDPDFQLIRVCKEDEGVSICAALSYSDTRALLLMQQTGLMDSLKRDPRYRHGLPSTGVHDGRLAGKSTK